MGLVLGPYERERRWAYAQFLTGTVDLMFDGARVTATVHAGEADLVVREEFDDAVTAFGVPETVRIIRPRTTLKLTIEAPLEALTFTVDPDGPGAGEKRRP